MDEEQYFIPYVFSEDCSEPHLATAIIYNLLFLVVSTDTNTICFDDDSKSLTPKWMEIDCINPDYIHDIIDDEIKGILLYNKGEVTPLVSKEAYIESFKHSKIVPLFEKPEIYINFD